MTPKNKTGTENITQKREPEVPSFNREELQRILQSSDDAIDLVTHEMVRSIPLRIVIHGEGYPHIDAFHGRGRGLLRFTPVVIETGSFFEKNYNLPSGFGLVYDFSYQTTPTPTGARVQIARGDFNQSVDIHQSAQPARRGCCAFICPECGGPSDNLSKDAPVDDAITQFASYDCNHHRHGEDYCPIHDDSGALVCARLAFHPGAVLKRKRGRPRNGKAARGAA